MDISNFIDYTLLKPYHRKRGNSVLNIKINFKKTNLIKPNRRISTSSMDKSNPFI